MRIWILGRSAQRVRTAGGTRLQFFRRAAFRAAGAAPDAGALRRSLGDIPLPLSPAFRSPGVLCVFTIEQAAGAGERSVEATTSRRAKRARPRFYTCEVQDSGAAAHDV